mmetsp:Transcript_10822/g.20552  ORF Transcript_10822/g.20552 Transcript_10822/m.20552 type:complete len:263 (+) Transcript_10822:844-1632(+)
MLHAHTVDQRLKPLVDFTISQVRKLGDNLHAGRSLLLVVVGLVSIVGCRVGAAERSCAVEIASCDAARSGCVRAGAAAVRNRHSQVSAVGSRFHQQGQSYLGELLYVVQDWPFGFETLDQHQERLSGSFAQSDVVQTEFAKQVHQKHRVAEGQAGVLGDDRKELEVVLAETSEGVLFDQRLDHHLDRKLLVVCENGAHVLNDVPVYVSVPVVFDQTEDETFVHKDGEVVAGFGQGVQQGEHARQRSDPAGAADVSAACAQQV